MSEGNALQVESHAPARICDLGGWTDTWFSGRGAVLAIAISPGATCRLEAAGKRSRPRARFTLEAVNSGDRYSFDPGCPPLERHPLLEASVAEAGVPRNLSVQASVSSPMPPGCGTGTSAAVSVALLGALLRLRGEALESEAVWKLAHRVETERLGWQSGIQDQICAAYGGVCFIEIESYPEARVSGLELPVGVAGELEHRMILVYAGRSRRSDEVHRRVIAGVCEGGRESAALEELRRIPHRGRAALLEGDLEGFGAAMVENTEAQRSLHPGLISGTADRVIEAARSGGACGWKVNGAGGEGGSLTILAGEDPDSAARIREAVTLLGEGIRVLPAEIDGHGLRVTGRAPSRNEGGC